MSEAVPQASGSGSDATAAKGVSWIDAELAGCALGDKRLRDRLRRLLHQLEGAIGAPLPLACQDWANTKAAYRFLSSGRFGEDAILAGHFQATASRFAAAAGLALVVQDTTEFCFRWAKPETIGAIGRVAIGRDRNGNPRAYTQCGLLMHTSFVVTPEGLPLGLAAVQFWTRKAFKGANELKRHVNPTRVPIEAKESIRWLSSLAQSGALLGDPGRCVYVGDRENDIYEFFCAAREAGTHFLVRTCVDRLAGDGRRTVARVMARVPVAGQHRIEVTAEDGSVTEVVLKLRYKRVHILPPIGKQKRYPALDLTVIHAREAARPRGRDRVDWKLVTDLAVTSPEEAVEKLRWYAQRWKIELSHKILKSGCRVEAARLRTAERLTKLIAVFCILGWRIFWTTMINRTAPDAPPRSALTEAEITVIDRVVRDRPTIPAEKTLAHYLMKVACLGGYLARARDPPPGNTVMWRGWSRLMDMMLGADLMQPNCG
ncbi:MAG TPA: IS4 family transposase [Geminicoccaceae bacterium]|nr:IS4 family transposase [Geminicoccaceae bacterium]